MPGRTPFLSGWSWSAMTAAGREPSRLAVSRSPFRERQARTPSGGSVMERATARAEVTPSVSRSGLAARQRGDVASPESRRSRRNRLAPSGRMNWAPAMPGISCPPAKAKGFSGTSHMSRRVQTSRSDPGNFRRKYVGWPRWATAKSRRARWAWSESVGSASSAATPAGRRRRGRTGVSNESPSNARCSCRYVCPCRHRASTGWTRPGLIQKRSPPAWRIGQGPQCSRPRRRSVMSCRRHASIQSWAVAMTWFRFDRACRALEPGVTTVGLSEPGTLLSGMISRPVRAGANHSSNRRGALHEMEFA